MRAVSAERCSRNEAVSSCALLRTYVATVHGLGRAVKADALAGKLKLREPRAGLQLSGLQLSLGFRGRKPLFDMAPEWSKALAQKNTVLAYERLQQWNPTDIHFDEAVSVMRTEFIQWTLDKGICAPGELDRLLAHTIAITEPSAPAPDPSNAPVVSGGAGTAGPAAVSATNGRAPIAANESAVPKKKKKATDAFVADLWILISEISRRAAEQGLPFSKHEMPGVKADLQELAVKFNENLDKFTPRTFDDYLSTLVQFKNGARKTDFYRKLFPEYFR
jgi:hypothetical protein